MFAHVEDTDGGIAVDYLNDWSITRDVDYASATAPDVCYVEICIVRSDDRLEIVDGVYVGNGESHSWWSGAHGKLLRRGLAPGERLIVQGDGRFAFRWDWTDE